MSTNTNDTAILVMDMQSAILKNLPDPDRVILNVKKAISQARNNQIQVLYVTVGFRKNTPEINPANKSFSAGKERFSSVSTEEFLKIHPELTPAENEITIIKKRISAFAGSDLEIILRSLGIHHLVLTGVATSGVVLSTTREAADKDYQLTILADCCADADEEVHRVLTGKVFPRQATVLNLSEWH